jgi:hypothetical protein
LNQHPPAFPGRLTHIDKLGAHHLSAHADRLRTHPDKLNTPTSKT